MAAPLTTDAVLRALAREFRTAIEAVGGGALTERDGAAATGAGWATPIVAGGEASGTLTLWIDQAGVRNVARAMMGLDEEPEAAVTADMLRELWNQAASAAMLVDGFAGLTLAPGTPAPAHAPAGAPLAVLHEDAGVLATLHAAGTLNAAARRAEGASGAHDAGADAEHADNDGSGGGLPENLARLLDIDLPLVARFARTEMSLRALTQLGPGSLVDMGRSPDAPVQLLVGGHVVAEGEVVVVGGNYGVRIMHLVSPADRLKAMEL